MEKNPVEGYMDNSIACVFTMMLPGLGQMLVGKGIPGIIWSVVVGCGYLVNGWFGMTVHVLCILDAAFNGTSIQKLVEENLLRRGMMLAGLSCLLFYTCYRTGLF